MDEVNLFETEFYHTVEKICGFMETDFYKKLTPQMRPFFDDIITLTIYLMEPKQCDHTMKEVIEAMNRCQKYMAFGDKIIEPIKSQFIGYSFGMN